MDMKNVTQVVPPKMEKWIKKNKSMFGRRIEQLDHILKDSNFLVDGGYRDFIVSMYKALISGRKVTPKMESSITKIVASYSKTLSPEYQKKKLDYTENTISKLNMIKRRLDECNYTRSYTSEKLYFLDSIERQVYSRGKLSIKQRKAMNKMYTQFTKKIGKNEKFEKKIEKVKKSLDFIKYYS